MSDHRREARNHALASADEREVSSLLTGAGRRPEVPDTDMALLKATARVEWHELVESRRRPWRSLVPLAAAATLALVLGAVWWSARPGPPTEAPTVAVAEAVRGLARATGDADSVTRGAAFAAGAELETAVGNGASTPFLTLRLAGGPSLRLDADTRVRLHSATSLELERGALYVDTGAEAEGARRLEILTALGAVHDIGTQFEVRLTGNGHPQLRLRVREGEVELERPGATLSAVSGEELTVRGDGEVRRARVTSTGEPWRWVVQAAPAFEIEGRKLGDYLGWVARETGWSVEYTDPELAAAGETIVLHGAIDGLTPADSLELVVPGSGLAYEVSEGRLLIRRSGSS